MKRHALRRRYGKAYRTRGGHAYTGTGHIEVALISDGRWAATWKAGPKEAPAGPAFVGTRAEAIKQGQKEAAQRGIPFVMGI